MKRAPASPRSGFTPTPLVLALALALPAATVRAQATSAEPPAGTPAETTLPKIKATANAASEDSPLGYLGKEGSTGALGDKAILDTPFSITVVDSQDILARGAKSIGQIFFNDPSVYTPTNSVSTDWWGTQIRGLGVRNMYVDDVPVLLYWGGDFPTEAVDSVSALKGLTGFMFGFGEPGGALSYRLKRPLAANETSVTLGYRNPSLLSAHVDTSHRLGDNFSLRANVATEQGTAYNAAEVNRTMASLALDQRLGTSLLWQTTFLYEDNKLTGEPLQFYLSGYDVEGSGGKLPEVSYDYDDFNVENAYYKTRTLFASTGLRWAIDDQWTALAQVGFTRKNHQSNKAFATLLNRAGDYEGTMYNFAGQLDNLYVQGLVQGELTTGAVRHELVAGLGSQRATDRWAPEFYWSNDFNGNLYTEQPFRVTRTPDFGLDPVSYHVNQHYLFASDTLHFGDHWQAIVGLRHTRYELKDLDGDPAVDSGYRTSATTPTLAVVFKPGPRTSVYGSFVEGLEPGSRVSADAVPPYANAGEVLGATISRQLEVGVKHSARGIDYTAALFQIQRANQIDTLRDGQRYLTQDGRVTYRGIEANASAQVTSNLALGLGAIHLDASIDRVSPDNAALEGNTPSNAPKWQVVGNVAYKVPGLAGLKLHGNWRYFGATWVDDANSLKVPDRHVVNAGFSYDFPLQGKAWTLHANVHNLLDEKYWASGGWGAGNVGEGRNYSLSLVTQF